MKFVTGDGFYKIADFNFWDKPNDSDYDNWPNTYVIENVEAFNGIPIVFTVTSHIEEFLPVLAKTNKRVVLCTHSTDWGVDEARYNRLPPNVIHWFCPNIRYRGERVDSVPIGLETAQRFEFHHIHKQEKMIAKCQEEKTLKNLLFICHSSHQVNIADREEPYKLLANKPWVTAVHHPNIFGFDDYIDNIYRHKFMISPEGSGVDCHRTWECLYLDTIPIVKRCVNMTYYENDVPICFVNEWSEVTEEFLNSEYERILSQEWPMNKIDMDYWEKRVKSFTKE